MTKRRPTLEQQRTALQLGTLAAPYRFRVIADAEGLPIIPGRYGRIERYCDGVNCWSCPLPRQVALAVYSDRPRLFHKLQAIPGVLRHQSGDAEISAVFAVELLEQVGDRHSGEAVGWGWTWPARELRAQSRTTGHFPALQATSGRGSRVAEAPLGSRRESS